MEKGSEDTGNGEHEVVKMEYVIGFISKTRTTVSGK